MSFQCSFHGGPWMAHEVALSDMEPVGNALTARPARPTVSFAPQPAVQPLPSVQAPPHQCATEATEAIELSSDSDDEVPLDALSARVPCPVQLPSLQHWRWQERGVCRVEHSSPQHTLSADDEGLQRSTPRKRKHHETTTLGLRHGLLPWSEPSCGIASAASGSTCSTTHGASASLPPKASEHTSWR